MIELNLTLDETQRLCDLLKDEIRRIGQKWSNEDSTAVCAALTQAQDTARDLLHKIRECKERTP